MDIFSYSNKIENQLADAIMKCAPVQISKRDEMPKVICQLCYTQLGNIHQFQMQIVQSEKKLRCYLTQLHTSGWKVINEYSIEKPPEDHLIHKTNADITVKRESLKQHAILDMTPTNYNNSINKIKEEMPLKSEIDDEPIDDNSLNNTESPSYTINVSQDDGCEINCEDTKISIDHMSKSEIEEEPTDDNSLILTRSPFDTKETLSQDDGSENSCEGTKISIGHISEKFTRLHSMDGTKYFGKGEKGNNKHTDEKSYQCEICDRCFSRSDVLKQHKRTHSGDKPYRCDICNKYFAQSGCLNIHKRTHTGEKPYQCDVCDKCFSHSSDLSKHRRTHTGEKPYQCDICNKCFTNLGNLNEHKRIHTGEKPYQCHICNKYFAHSGNLNRHKRTHTGE